MFGISGKPGFLEGEGAQATSLNYTPITGTAFTDDTGAGTNAVHGLSRIDLYGSGAANDTIGVRLGGTQGAELAIVSDANIRLFGTGLTYGSNTWITQIRHVLFGVNGQNLKYPKGLTNSGENLEFNHVTFANSANLAAGVQIAGFSDIRFVDCSFDDSFVTISAPAFVQFINPHFEDPNASTTADYITIYGSSGTVVDIFGGEFEQDFASARTQFVTINTGTLNIYGGAWRPLAPLSNGGVNVTGPATNVSWYAANVSGTAFPYVGGVSAGRAAISVLGVVGQSQLKTLKISDQGSCTMISGSCPPQILSQTYASAPNCVVTWNGTGELTGILKAPSTTTTVTPASSVSSDTARVNFVCFGK